MSDLPPELFRHWIFSHDDSGVSVYRPFGTKLPPARARNAFEIRENGEFLRYDIGPVDRSRAVRGQWRVDAPGQLRVGYDDGRENVLELVELGSDELKIRTREG